MGFRFNLPLSYFDHSRLPIVLLFEAFFQLVAGFGTHPYLCKDKHERKWSTLDLVKKFLNFLTENNTQFEEIFWSLIRAQLDSLCRSTNISKSSYPGPWQVDFGIQYGESYLVQAQSYCMVDSGIPTNWVMLDQNQHILVLNLSLLALVKSLRKLALSKILLLVQ